MNWLGKKILLRCKSGEQKNLQTEGILKSKRGGQLGQLQTRLKLQWLGRYALLTAEESKKPTMIYVLFTDFCFSLFGNNVGRCKVTWHSDNVIASMKVMFEDFCSIEKKIKITSLKPYIYNIRKHRITTAFHHILKLDSKNDK